MQFLKLQVLARFEGFPVKKLEALRTAAALYTKLDSIISELHNWKIVTPMGQLLDKVESYFTKVIWFGRCFLFYSKNLYYFLFISMEGKFKPKFSSLKGSKNAIEL